MTLRCEFDVVCLTNQIPAHALRAVFTTDVMERLQGMRFPSENTRWRMNVLQACGPMPSDPSKRIEVRAWRAQKAAWEAYVSAAFLCGLFEGAPGADLRARLTGDDDDNFRGATAECMACWFLQGPLKLGLSRVSLGEPDDSLDMQATTATASFGIEVKAPYRERPRNEGWSGDESDKIIQCVQAANKQFQKNRANVLVLAPMLRTQIFFDRESLLHALFVESVLAWYVDVGDNDVEVPHESWTEFRPSGCFLNTKAPSGNKLKQSGQPRYQRISAILCIEEVLVEKFPSPLLRLLPGCPRKESRDTTIEIMRRQKEAYLSPGNQCWITHRALIVHNPHAYHRLPEGIWAQYPQLVPRGDVMEWTDGYECVV